MFAVRRLPWRVCGSIGWQRMAPAAGVPSADRTIRDDLRVTGLTRTLLDCARTGSAPEQLLMAVREGRARGMLRPGDIARLRAVYPFRGRIR